MGIDLSLVNAHQKQKLEKSIGSFLMLCLSETFLFKWRVTMEGNFKALSGSAKKVNSRILMGIGFLAITSLSGLSGWLYFELDKTSQELVGVSQLLTGTEAELDQEKQRSKDLSNQVSDLNGQVSSLTDQVSGLEGKVSGLGQENKNLQTRVNSTTQDLNDQKVISECMTAFVRAIALAETPREFYALVLPYETVCTEAVELMD